MNRMVCQSIGIGGIAAMLLAGAGIAQVGLPELVVTARRSAQTQREAPARQTVRAPAPVRTAGPREPRQAPNLRTLGVPNRERVGAPIDLAPRTELGRQELESEMGGQLGNVLFNQPGVSSSTYAPGANRPIIRGLDSVRVRVQENGVGSGDVSDLGEDHAVPIDPLAGERVEIIRGPSTLRYGSQAIGGVVSLTNNRIPEALPERDITFTSRGAFSSVDNGIEALTAVDGRAGPFAFHADAFRRQADDYRIPGGGIQPNTRLTAQGEALGGSYVWDRGFAGLALQHYTSLYHIPGVSAAAANTRIDLEQYKLTAKGEWRPGTDVVEAVRYWAGVSDYKHNELGFNAEGVDGIRATFKNREQEARTELQFRGWNTAFGALRTAAGVQLRRRDLSTAGEGGGLLAPAEEVHAGGYIFNELQVTQALRLQAAGRMEFVNVRGTGALFPPDLLGTSGDRIDVPVNRNFNPGSFAAGLLYALPWDIMARLTGQYAQRAPRAQELFSRGPHESTRTFDIGDPGLTKETAQTVEIGMKRSIGALRFDASVYRTRYENFIFRRITGIRCGEEFSTCGLEDELAQIVYGQRNATFLGAEFATQLDAVRVGSGWLGVDGQYDVVRARFEDGTNVPRIPPQRLGAGVFWRSDHWFTRIGLLHAFSQEEVAENETPTPGYNNLRAEIRYTYKLRRADTGPEEITAGVVGDNVLDAEIRNHAAFNKHEVLLPGRNIRLFATVKF